MDNLPIKLNRLILLDYHFNLDNLPENLKILELYCNDQSQMSKCDIFSNLPIGLKLISINNKNYTLAELINSIINKN